MDLGKIIRNYRELNGLSLRQFDQTMLIQTLARVGRVFVMSVSRPR